MNNYFLESGRWATDSHSESHKQWQLLTLLFVTNFIVGNVWLYQVNKARLDLTEGQQYSISDATRNYLNQLNEPLLIRGFFSAKTHPLLAPLVPQLRDLLTEYQVAADGKVRTEFIDPHENPDLEKEAGEKYGIKPVPFQVSDKYQAALVNSYFDILIQYGDQFQVLGFRDLIEVKSQQEGDIDVKLRNPEYEITRSIKKVLNEYQGGGNLFSGMEKPIEFSGFWSDDSKLPAPLKTLKQEIVPILNEIKTSSKGKFDFKMIDPDANGGKVAKDIQEKYGFRPMQAGLFDPNTFYAAMVLESNGQSVQVPIPQNLDKESFRTGLQSAIKRFSSGFMKTIALSAPAPNPQLQQMRIPSGDEIEMLKEKLGENHSISQIDLADGFVDESADLLMLVSPDKLNEKQVFAVDQFLMKGGTVILGTAAFNANLAGGTLAVSAHDSGLNDWLKHNGITVEKSMVLDPQNAKLPIPVSRDLGGFAIQEIQMAEYPYFVDIRKQGLAQGGAITSGLPQVTLNWASPLTLDQDKNKGRKITRLLSSSDQAWTSDSTTVEPDFDRFGDMGFAQGDKRNSYLLAASVEGTFTSFFKGKESPLLKDDKTAPKSDADKTAEKDKPKTYSSIIEKSPESARIIVISSNDFLTDQVIRMSASSGGTNYLNTLQLVENAMDWSLEDQGLLSIRSRSHFSRTLFPISQATQRFWEYLNYGLSLLGLFVVYLLFRFKRNQATQHYQEVLAFAGDKA